jgi:hypothetical protein
MILFILIIIIVLVEKAFPFSNIELCILPGNSTTVTQHEYSDSEDGKQAMIPDAWNAKKEKKTCVSQMAGSLPPGIEPGSQA